ncbi:MAG: DUF1152 domain-containing protein [Candidatus Odinarchaeum yellowstonii]|uniref:DUF1152 domain-containing protein n=1 Tax=Odinarchaeota yellowstonii (strain LCB_4) TaxID=1841599 RepID=A0AAF0D186_ODILC|nr:MAG: DUF1152 domain-containing protein [Candidatus Odinarchaeum yellowstonii]
MVAEEFNLHIKNVKKALVLGIGGGGDILGALPTRNYLKNMSIECRMGCVAYERSQYDSKPGPRSLNEIENVIKVNDTVALASDATKTSYGLEFQASGMSRFLGENTVLIDITRGVEGVRVGLEDFCRKFSVNLVVGVDVGGDVIASGYEKGLRSPLTDAIMLAALKKLSVNTIIGVFGVCCDGELKLHEISDRLAKIYSEGGFIGAIPLSFNDIEIMREAVKYVKTEASRLPILIAEGRTGETSIRGGSRIAELTFFSIFTYYLKTDTVYKNNMMAQKISNSKSFLEAYEILEKIGVTTEYGLQLKRKGLF